MLLWYKYIYISLLHNYRKGHIILVYYFTNVGHNAAQQIPSLLHCVMSKWRKQNCAVSTKIRSNSALYWHWHTVCCPPPTQTLLHHIGGGPALQAGLILCRRDTFLHKHNPFSSLYVCCKSKTRKTMWEVKICLLHKSHGWGGIGFFVDIKPNLRTLGKVSLA